MKYTLLQLQHPRESEDRVEFKEAKHNYPFSGGSHYAPKERRRCVLGYVVALANEGGGLFVMGLADKSPHTVVDSDFAKGKTGALEDEIYKRLAIRVHTEELYEGDKRVLMIEVPSRPVGRLLKFEGVPLMRTGESLREMSDTEIFRILSEQVLSDLELLQAGKLNYAALILLGKVDVLRRHLPQCAIVRESDGGRPSLAPEVSGRWHCDCL